MCMFNSDSRLIILQGHYSIPLQLQHLASLCNCDPGVPVIPTADLTTVMSIHQPSLAGENEKLMDIFVFRSCLYCKDGDILQEGDLR